jgi:poly(3-hydroxybutyrate) depolymerase
MSNFQMLSDDDLKAGGAAAEVSSKPSLITRMRNRPLTSLAIIASIIIAIVLAIALPVALSGGNSDSQDSGVSNGNSGSSHTGSGSGAKPSSTSSAAPHRPTKMAGCGTPHAGGYSDSKSNHNITSSGNARYYTIDVPANYNNNKSDPWPLILDFHGANRDAANQYNNSQYFAESRGDDYIVVYPEGMDGKWESASYAVKGADDVQFISDLLDQLDNNYCINSDRVYASGKSNGGGFVDLLACSDLGDSFAAFAMASAALYSDNYYKDKSVDGCPKSRAILESHGGEDSTVPYTGQSSRKGTGGKSPDIPDWLGWWARRDGCKKHDDPVLDNKHDGYNITSYSCGGFDDVVQGYYIPDLNHCWPSADGNNSDSGARENGCSFRGLDFTSVVLDWFGRWDRNNAPQN